ncbi:hypothetical protein Ccr5_gp267 [Caulobacter phage Ccr5]|nr:hypothetical protein Ccr5_gp267 [Caulobacter phage Ccr5]
MAYAIPDLSTYTFHDPKVERFAKAMISTIETAQTMLTAFANDLADNPLQAFEHSYGAKMAAAHRDVAKGLLNEVLDALLHGQDKTWAYIGQDLRERLMYRVIYAASNPPRSTNAESNDMARFVLRAEADMLDRMTKSRF